MTDDRCLAELLGVTSKNLTVRELYEMLEPLLDDFEEFEVRVSYDSDVVSTPIRNKLPLVREDGKSVKLWGY